MVPFLVHPKLKFSKILIVLKAKPSWQSEMKRVRDSIRNEKLEKEYYIRIKSVLDQYLIVFAL